MIFSIDNTSIEIVGSVHTFHMDSVHTIPLFFKDAYDRALVIYTEAPTRHDATASSKTISSRINDSKLFKKLRAVWMASSPMYADQADIFNILEPLSIINAIDVKRFKDNEFIPGAEDWIESQIAINPKPMRHLEAIETRQELFNTLPRQIIKDCLVGGTKPFATTQKERIFRESEFWYAQNEMEFARSMKERRKRDPQYNEVLLDRRNANWANKIATELLGTREPTLIVVGAGHLYGPNNLREALQKHNVTTTKI